MSIKAINWAVSLSLEPFQKLVLMMLANHANDKNECWPSIDCLSKETGLCKRAIINNISILDQKELIVKQRRCDEYGHKKANLYVLNLPLGATDALRDYANKSTKVNNPLVQQMHLGLGAVDALRESIPKCIPGKSLSAPQVIPKCTTCTKDSIYTFKSSIEPSVNQPSPDEQKDVHQVSLNNQKHDYLTLDQMAKTPLDLFDDLQTVAEAKKEKLSAGFEEFWKAYPRKVAKIYCTKIWKSKRLAKYLPEMLDDLKQRTDWHKGNPMTPHPSTYLNQGRWEDEEKAPCAAPKKKNIFDVMIEEELALRAQQKNGEEENETGQD